MPDPTVQQLEALIDQLSTGPWWTALQRYVQRRRAIKALIKVMMDD